MHAWVTRAGCGRACLCFPQFADQRFNVLKCAFTCAYKYYIRQNLSLQPVLVFVFRFILLLLLCFFFRNKFQTLLCRNMPIYMYVHMHKYEINAWFTYKNRNFSCLSWYLTFGDKLGHHSIALQHKINGSKSFIRVYVCMYKCSYAFTLYITMYVHTYIHLQVRVYSFVWNLSQFCVNFVVRGKAFGHDAEWTARSRGKNQSNKRKIK